MSLGLLATPTVTICKVAKMVFNVAPGNFYLSQYLEYQEANGTSATVEALAGLAGGTDAAFVTTVLTNLGLADDAGASAFLTSAVAASGRGAALEAAIDALNNVASDDATYGAAKTAFDTAIVTSVSYSTNTANSSTDAAVLANAITEGAVATANNQTLVLTTSVDVVVGGAGDDTILGDSNTTSGGDSVNGGEGTDTVVIDGSYTIPTMTNVENLIIKGATAADFDVAGSSNAAGIESVTIDGFTANAKTITVKNGQDVGLKNGTGAAADVVITGATSVVAQTVNIEASGDSTNAIDLEFDGTKVAAITLNATGSSESFVDVDATSALKTLTVNATSDLTIENVEFATTINAADSTGDVTVDSAVAKVSVTGGTGNDTITMDHTSGSARVFTVNAGAGDDTVSLGVMALAADLTDNKVTVDGGEGEDTLGLDAAGAVALSALSDSNYAKKGITGFEKVSLNDAMVSGTVDFSKFGVNYVITTADAAAGVDVTYKGLTSGATLEFGKSVDAIGDSGNNATEVITVDLSDKAGNDDVVNLIFKNTTGAGNFDIEAQNVETINIDTSSSDQTNTLDLEGAQVSVINVTADAADTVITHRAGGTVVTEVNATNATGSGGVTYTTASSAITGVTFRGGAGGDDFTGGDQDDVAIGGAGDDKFDMAAGTGNTVDLSAGGDDEIEINSLTGKVTVTGFASGDVVDIQQDKVDGTEESVTAQQSSAVNPTTDGTMVVTLNAATTSVLVGGSETIADFTDTTDVAAYLEEGFADAAADEVAFVLNDGTDSYVYIFDEAGNNTTIANTEITLVAVVNGYTLGTADVAQTV